MSKSKGFKAQKVLACIPVLGFTAVLFAMLFGFLRPRNAKNIVVTALCLLAGICIMALCFLPVMILSVSPITGNLNLFIPIAFLVLSCYLAGFAIVLAEKYRLTVKSAQTHELTETGGVSCPKQ